MRETHQSKEVSAIALALTVAFVLSMVPGSAGKPQLSSQEAVPAFDKNAEFVLVQSSSVLDSGLIADCLASLGIPIVEIYDSFVMAAPNDDQKKILSSIGLEVVEMPDRTVTGRGTLVFDTRFGEPTVLEEMRVSNLQSPGYDLRIVQFIGPIKQSWVDSLNSMGVELLGYLPSYSFVVGMNPATARNVESMPYVQWVGVYHPAYKLPCSLTIDGCSSSDVAILTRPGNNCDVVAHEIALAGGAVSKITKRWGASNVIASLSGKDARALARLPEVLWIDRVAPVQLYNANMTWVLQSNLPYQQTIFEHGLDGATMAPITIADTGIDVNHEMFYDPWGYPPGPKNRKIAAYYVPSDSGGTLGDEYGHGTHVAGTVAGDAPDDGEYYTYNKYDGQAFGSRLIFQDIASNLGLIPPTTTSDLFELAYNAGSRIHTNSWGMSEAWAEDSILYDPISENIDSFVWNHPDFLILFAAGNSQDRAPNEPYTGGISVHGCSKNVVTVGASLGKVDSNDLVYFPYPHFPSWASARGPTGDGRMKPTVIAPGVDLMSAQNGVADGYVLNSGTSMATPAMAGTAALVRQYFVDGWYPTGTPILGNGFSPSAALLRAILINSAQEMTGWDAYGQDSAPGNWYATVKAVDVSPVSSPYCLEVLKAYGSSLPARAHSKIIDFDYSSDYTFETSFKLVADPLIQHMILFDDGRAYIEGTGSSALGIGGITVGRDWAGEAEVPLDTWHTLRIDYYPSQGVYEVAVNGVYLEGSFSFEGAPYKRILVGTDQTPSAKHVRGTFYYDDMQYVSASGPPTEYFSDDFDDGDLNDWIILSGPREDLRYPNIHQGWGKVCLENALYFSGDNRGLWVKDETVGLAGSGSVMQYQINVQDQSQPLEVTLVWSDYPGTAGTTKALVNDLDLTVTDPSGVAYKGNVYAGMNPGISATGGQYDRVNVEEGVLVPMPSVGTWTVTVRANNIVFGPQPFALVMTQSRDLNVRYLEDFDDGNVSDWILDVGSGNEGGLSSAYVYSEPYSLRMMKAFGTRVPARATSPTISLDYSSEYWLSMRFYIPAGVTQKGMLIADDGRVRAELQPFGINTKLWVYGVGQSASMLVPSDTWCDLQILYRPSAGCFDAFMNGVVVGENFGFYSSPLKKLSLGTDAKVGNKNSGEVFFDEIQYVGKVVYPKQLLSDAFDDGTLAPWTATVTSPSIVAVSSSAYHSPFYSLYVKYSGRYVARAGSPSIAGDFTKDYTISMWLYVVNSKYVVVADDGRLEVVVVAGKLAAVTSSGTIDICSLSSGVWHKIEIKANPGTSSFRILVDGTQQGTSFSFKASSSASILYVGSKTSPGKKDAGEAYWDDISVFGYPG